MATVLNRTTKQLLRSVNTPDYPAVNWIANPDLSAVNGVPVEYWKVVGDVVSEMTQPEKDVVDGAGLGALRTTRYVAIDARTAALISAGFEYPAASGTIFSLSLESQHNVHGAYTSRNLPAFAYPVKWLSKDDATTTSLADAAAVEAFFLAALATIRGYKDAGSDLKEQVRAAATRAAVDAVVDAR